jgi:phenylalanyl-tRNA synthetase alpha chain
MHVQVLNQGRWLEVLGCGVIHGQVLANAGLDPEEVCGWAFGLGLERLAMVLFDVRVPQFEISAHESNNELWFHLQIPDIRLFWSEDERFLKQFVQGSGLKFVPYSKHPPCYKDVSFWLPGDTFHVNDLYEIIREVHTDRQTETTVLV